MAKKILIIEDEEILLNLLQKKLSHLGYEVFVAQDGDIGVTKIKEIKPDLILLDIVMPKMNGIEVMEEIIKDGELKKIPVIIISNSGQPLEIERAKELGARDWLIKTEFDPQEVIEKVIKQIGR
ncbi:MAG: response regulator [Candidatus Nealsonbacteria bacterium]|nr:response regulator [Candidatus Nealsonbacteria bacterium]